MTRKEFLALLAAGTAGRSFAQETSAPKPPRPPRKSAAPAAAKHQAPTKLELPPPQAGAYIYAGPMLALVSSDEARIWMRPSNPIGQQWQVTCREAIEGGAAVQTAEFSWKEGAPCGVAIVAGLKPSTRYEYAVHQAGEKPQSPLRAFVTAPENGNKQRQRIAFGSCVGRHPVLCAGTFGEMAARQPLAPEHGGFDLLLMLGDNHYADTDELEKLRTHYTAFRLDPGWTQLTSAVPVYAIWDDHDYGPNNSDGTLKGKADSLKAFHEFWSPPSRADQAENPGAYYTFTRGDVQFFMLDCRYHRSPNKTPDSAEKTMWGAAQLAWLKQELSASKASLKILANGSEWQSEGTTDSLAVFRHERDALFAWIDDQKIEGVMLLSGDRHFTAGYQVAGRLVELTSGPLGSGNATLRPNQERFTGADDGKLWMVLDVESAGAEPRVAYEIWQTGGGLLERRELTWDEVNGRAQIARSVLPLKPDRMEAKPYIPKGA